MIMSEEQNEYRLGRRPGYQGPRTPDSGLDKFSSQHFPILQPSTSTSSTPYRKRKLLTVDERNEYIDENWPRFLIMHSSDPTKPLSTLTPFVLWEGIIGSAGTPKKMTKLKSGDFLLELDKISHYRNLIKTKSILDIPIEIEPHKTLNSSRGIIRCREINLCTEQEIFQNLQHQNVTFVKRIYVKRDNNLVPTHTYLLDFNTPQLPKSVQVAWMNVEVEEYIPNPLRCFNCQQFGHHKSRCSKPATCVRCGLPAHEENPCSNTPSCVNCHEPHPSSDRKCKIFLFEKDVISTRNQLKISFPQARKIVAERTQTNTTTTYSNTVSKKVTTSTQTDSQSVPFQFHMNSTNSTQKTTPSSSEKTSETQTVPPTSQSLPQPKTSLTSSKNNLQKSNEKWVRGVNSPKPKNSRPTARASQKAVRAAITVQNRFGCLAGMEEMDTDISQSTPSSSPRSASSRSDKGGEKHVDISRQSNADKPSEGSQLEPVHDAWEGYGQEVVNSSPPKPVPPVPPDEHSPKPPNSKIQKKSTFHLNPISPPRN